MTPKLIRSLAVSVLKLVCPYSRIDTTFHKIPGHPGNVGLLTPIRRV